MMKSLLSLLLVATITFLSGCSDDNQTWVRETPSQMVFRCPKCGWMTELIGSEMELVSANKKLYITYYRCFGFFCSYEVAVTNVLVLKTNTIVKAP